MIRKSIGRAELGAVVIGALREALDDHPVLVGGAVVSIYTKGRYVSNDLDIVTYRESRQIRPVMKGLGFIEEGSYWRHPNTQLLVQFVSPPVMIGRKHVRQPAHLRTAAGELATISPLDSACDRLSWFLGGDAQALEQCVDVVIAQRVSLSAIANWLEDEAWPERHKQAALKTLKRMVADRRGRRARR